MTGIYTRLAQLSGLAQLQERFDAHVREERAPIHAALLRLMEKRHHLSGRCCTGSDIDWQPKLTRTALGQPGIYVEWMCERHGPGEGVTFAVTLLASEMTT